MMQSERVAAVHQRMADDGDRIESIRIKSSSIISNSRQENAITNVL